MLELSLLESREPDDPSNKFSILSPGGGVRGLDDHGYIGFRVGRVRALVALVENEGLGVDPERGVSSFHSISDSNEATNWSNSAR